VSAKTAEWYDQALPGSRATAPVEQASALPVYIAALNLMSVDPKTTVIDLGCGTGRFAEMLARDGHRAYFGIDFAPAVINEARRYCQQREYMFRVGDLRTFEHDATLPDTVCYVLLEVLEHLDDDRDLLNRLAPGQAVVLSVPNFWSESHVRRFLQPRDVFDRYGDLLDFTAWQSVPFTTPGRRIHVFAATTRTDRL
jgi:2-polyprenyl-3-methyl-5-hydroxy-6-metoxy-1,4-benzoquinol methylase